MPSLTGSPELLSDRTMTPPTARSSPSSLADSELALEPISPEAATQVKQLLTILCETLCFDFAQLYIEDCMTGFTERCLSAVASSTRGAAGPVGESDISVCSCVTTMEGGNSAAPPLHETDILRTPTLIALAKESERRCYWRCGDRSTATAASGLPPSDSPYFTEMAYILNPLTAPLEEMESGCLLIVVAYNTTKDIHMAEAKLSILEGLCKALYFTVVQLGSSNAGKGGANNLNRHRISISGRSDNSGGASHGSGGGGAGGGGSFRLDREVHDKPQHSRSLASVARPAPSLPRAIPALALAPPPPSPSSTSTSPQRGRGRAGSAGEAGIGGSSSTGILPSLSPSSAGVGAGAGAGGNPKALQSRPARSLDFLSAINPYPSSSASGAGAGAGAAGEGDEFPSDSPVFMCQPGQIVVGLGSSPKSLFSFRKTPDIALAPSSSPAPAPASAPSPAPMYSGGWGLGGAGGVSASASPFQSFRARLEDVPVCNVVPTGLGMNDLVDIKWLIDGSHANLFIASYRPPLSAGPGAEAGPLVKVVVKMLKKESLDKSVARKEFEMEMGILSRVSSPHVVKLLGVGTAPRPFMVLEWLSKGTLSALLSQNLSVSDFFRRPVFPKRVLYTHILNLAECLRYLHEDVGGPGSQTCIVHRDLKPDNIGIGADGSIKLLDFGLAVCVRQRSSLDEAYDMTGFTGSLRYMSPEVAQRRPYNERVDQYSFALVVWQMATGQTPFKGFTKDQLLQEVVAEGRRPPLDSKQISPDLAKLLARCWHASPSRRPAFSEVVAEMARMLDKECGAESRPLAAQVGSSGASAWF